MPNTLDESKMSEVHMNIGDNIDHHIAAYKNNKLNADALGAHCGKVAKKIATMHKIPHEYATKLVNDYVDGELSEETINESEWKVGDVVYPNQGPHKGLPHEVIHDHGDGRYNIKPKNLKASQIKYRLGAVSANASQLEGKPSVKEETEQLDEISMKTIDSYLRKKENRYNKEITAAEPKETQVIGKNGKPIKNKSYIDPSDNRKARAEQKKIEKRYEKSMEPARKRSSAFHNGRQKDWTYTRPESDFEGVVKKYFARGKEYGEMERAAEKAHKDHLEKLKKHYTEEVELAELNKTTLASYVGKAAKRIRSSTSLAKSFEDDMYDSMRVANDNHPNFINGKEKDPAKLAAATKSMKAAEQLKNDLERSATNRIKGIAMAGKKLAREETEQLDESDKSLTDAISDFQSYKNKNMVAPSTVERKLYDAHLQYKGNNKDLHNKSRTILKGLGYIKEETKLFEALPDWAKEVFDKEKGSKKRVPTSDDDTLIRNPNTDGKYKIQKFHKGSTVTGKYGKAYTTDEEGNEVAVAKVNKERRRGRPRKEENSQGTTFKFDGSVGKGSWFNPQAKVPKKGGKKVEFSKEEHDYIEDLTMDVVKEGNAYEYFIYQDDICIHEGVAMTESGVINQANRYTHELLESMIKEVGASDRLMGIIKTKVHK